MFANGNSYGNSQSDLSTTNGGSLEAGLVSPTPRWFLPVKVWHPRPGK